MIQLTTLRVASIAILSCAPCGSTASAQSTQASTPINDAEDRGWPRQFEAEGHEIIVHAPQPDEWPKFEHITFRAAITVGPKGSDQKTYGILRVRADTKVAFEERLVILTNRKIEELSFSNVDAAESQRLMSIVMAGMPHERPLAVSLDRLVAAMDPAKIDVRKVHVSVTPPKIIHSDKPALLVIFMGKSRFKPVPDNDLMFAINTNWDVFLDPAANRYYLLDGHSWLTSVDLDKGPWTAAASLPAGLSRLPANENWNDVRAAIPLVPPQGVRVVHVSHEPAELVVIEGEPELTPITGTRLMLVANTESSLLFDTADKQYYLLAAGRWFKASSVSGPWSAASGALPADFKKIPENSDAGHVLSAVPGTLAANEAIILASIPQMATINRADVKVVVTYDGVPKFLPIEPTTVQYAYNSPFNVFLIEGKYYCCHNAVWFVAPTPTGAWLVCDAVPKVIYTIPPTSSKYYVTYVTVYESTPTTVVVGYTAGYGGATVAATGVVVFGLGYLTAVALEDDCCWGYHYPPCYFSYGCGAVWYGSSGGYVCASSVYGPYGGAGHAAAYNPATGVYSRAGYAYGPNGAAGYRTAYNPTTGVAAGRAGGATPYGSWGRSAVTNGDEWVRAGHSTTASGTVGGIQGSGGGAAVTAQGRYGNGATVAKSQDGDLYAAKDGNVYKQADTGWEQTRNSSTGTHPASASTTIATATRPASQALPQTSSELQQQATARERGESNTAHASEYRNGTAAGVQPGRGARAGRGPR